MGSLQQNSRQVLDINTHRRHIERQQELSKLSNSIPEQYKSEIESYLLYCAETSQPKGSSSLLDYLFTSIKEQRVKKNTWEKRLAAIKKYLVVELEEDLESNATFKEETKLMRLMYNSEENASLKRIQGKSHLDKDELLEMIYELDTREKAICLFNLVTASRPSEMTRIQIQDIDLESRQAHIYLKKQEDWHTKRITQELVRVLKEYVREYKLKPEDYLIGRVLKNGRYRGVQVTERAYNMMLDKWLGISAYNLRKTQVASMHEAGADLSTIAEQTGHKSLDTLSKHYLNVASKTVDKYL